MRNQKPEFMHRAESAFQRSKVYRLLSYAFLYPTSELFHFFQDSFPNEIASGFETHPLKPNTSGLLEDLRRSSFDSDSMADEYIRLLTLKSKCPPYENEYYITKYYVYSTEPMADIAGFYRAFGMGFSGERPDHIGAELELMHIATMKEAAAASDGLREEMELCVSIQKKFLEDHLGRWIDAFVDALEKDGSSIYRPIALIMKEWVDLECRYLGAKPEKLTDVFFREIEDRDDANQSCPVRCGHEQLQ